MFPNWFVLMMNWLGIAKLPVSVGSGLRWLKQLYEVVKEKRRHALVPAEELMRYDDLYVGIMKDMLSEAHRLTLDVMREFRLSGDRDVALRLGRLSRWLEDLRTGLKAWRPREEKRKYNREILDYVNLAAVCECHHVYEGAEVLTGLPEEAQAIHDASRGMAISMRKVRLLRNTLSWALNMPSPQEFLEALRSEALKKAGGIGDQAIDIYSGIVRVAEAFVIADSVRGREAHKRIAPYVLEAIRSLSPVGKPVVRLDELWTEVRVKVPSVGPEELKKSIDYLWNEGLLPKVVRAGKKGPVAVYRPEGLEPEIRELIRTVRSDDRLRLQGFDAVELMSVLGWSREVINEVLSEMEKAGLAWPRLTPEGVKWFIPQLYGEGEGGGERAGLEA